MKKVLLIYDDYAESAKTQTYLKKVGFDVLLQNHDQRIADLILSFNPDLIVACGTQKFTSLSVGIKLREISSLRAKTILVIPQGQRPQPLELTKARVDVMIEAPVGAERMIQVIAKLTSNDPEHFLEKFKKAKLSDPSLGDSLENALGTHEAQELAVDPSLVQGVGYQREKIDLNDQTRAEKYQKFVQQIQIDKSQTSHSRQAIKIRQAELKKDWDFDLLGEIDKLKQQFTRALFKK